VFVLIVVVLQLWLPDSNHERLARGR
jgi:hypothetical protein